MTTWLVVILILAVLAIGILAALGLIFVIWLSRPRFETAESRTRHSSADKE